MTLKRRKLIRQQYRGIPPKALQCQHCSTVVENLPADTIRVTCWRCVAKSISPVSNSSDKVKLKRGRPRKNEAKHSNESNSKVVTQVKRPRGRPRKIKAA